MTDIIIAKYKEDVSWNNKFTKSRIFIYDKHTGKEIFVLNSFVDDNELRNVLGNVL